MRLLIVLALCVACGKNQEPPPPTSGSPTAQPESGPRGKKAGGHERAAQKFGTFCAMCHGTDGRGNGPAAASLNPKPRDYTDPAWQASVTDDDIKKIIVGGGAAVGKSQAMPGQPDLAQDPDMLDGFVQIIRGFAKR